MCTNRTDIVHLARLRLWKVKKNTISTSLEYGKRETYNGSHRVNAEVYVVLPSFRDSQGVKPLARRESWDTHVEEQFTGKM